MKILFPVILLLFFSCSNQPSENRTDSISHSDTIAKTDSVPLLNPEPKVTMRFLAILHHIDSSGYSFDTARYRKIYGWQGKLLTEGNDPRPFYNRDYQSTEPAWYIREGAVEFGDDYKINPHLFDSLQSVYASFFVRKNPEPGYSDKLFTDGILEEWKFSSKANAEKAAGELYSHQAMVWVHCGAHISTIDNYLYIFHTRSSAFYYLIKPFADKFVKDNHAVVPKTKLKS